MCNSKLPADWIDTDPRHPAAAKPQSYPEDFSHENGNYINVCIGCRESFIGHKRRFVCKLCDTKAQEAWNAMSSQERQTRSVEIFVELHRLQQDQKERAALEATKGTTTTNREWQIRQLIRDLHRQLPTVATTYSQCACGRQAARGGGPCVQCVTDDLSRAVGPDLAVKFVAARQAVHQIEMELYAYGKDKL